MSGHTAQGPVTQMREIRRIGDMPVTFGNRLATGVQTPV